MDGYVLAAPRLCGAGKELPALRRSLRDRPLLGARTTKFVEAAEITPPPANEALDLIGALYAAEAECESDDDRARIRAARSRGVVRRIQDWALKHDALPRSPLRKAIAYMGDLWPGSLRFLDDPRLALYTNAT